MLEKLSELMKKANEKGINIPLLRDASTGRGSVTLTMFWISFNIAILALIGKVSKLAGDIEYSSVIWFYAVTGAFYLGRKVQTGKNGVDVGDSLDPSSEKKENLND
jgi:hypothetical protein